MGAEESVKLVFIGQMANSSLVSVEQNMFSLWCGELYRCQWALERWTADPREEGNMLICTSLQSLAKLIKVN